MNKWFKDIKDKREGLWKEWNNTNDRDKRKYLLNELMNKHPETIDWLFTTAQSIYGPHRVYLIRIEYKGNQYLKIGYTKNTIKERFNEKRYNGAEDFKLIEIIKEDILQAGGAVEFEDWIKGKVKGIETDMKMPGKGELFELDKLNDILNEWNKGINDFSNLVKIKSPN